MLSTPYLRGEVGKSHLTLGESPLGDIPVVCIQGVQVRKFGANIASFNCELAETIFCPKVTLQLWTETSLRCSASI